MKDHVILVHGLARSSASMNRLQRGLAKAGFVPHAWSYPSRRRRLQGHVDAFREWLEAGAFDGPVHFVGHSLGGLIIRGAMASNPPVTLGRIVMIATPNQGAGAVTRNADSPLSRLIFGLPLQDLTENSENLKKLGVPDTEIGLIAGNKRFHPFNPVSYANWFHYAGLQHDGTVELANTRLKGATDSITVGAHHTFICDHPAVIEQTIAFLTNGRFDA